MTAAATRLLVVDDEPQIRRFLKTSLGVHGYDVIEADSGAAALRMATTARPDMMILDLGLPDQDGAEIIKRIREWSKIPIVVLSARGEEAAKVAALDQGADDYVTKPFGMNELLARLRAALRHRLQEQGAEPVLKLGPLQVDLARRLVTRDGQEVKLSPREYDLLRQLVIHAGKVLTHQHLLREVWGPAHTHDTQYLRVYVGQLRHKLEADPTHPQFITTEPGVGYRLRLDE
ncbi:MAG: response regulator [Alphaproteobacteria bacterium]|nr:response regulator [Alphaproteobacteria bacterium]